MITFILVAFFIFVAIKVVLKLAKGAFKLVLLVLIIILGYKILTGLF